MPPFIQDLITLLQSEFTSFTGTTNLLNLLDFLKADDLSWLLTIGGFGALVGFLFPTMIFLEMIASGIKGTFRWKNFRMQVIIYFTNRVIGKVITLQLGFTFFAFLQPYSIIDTSVTWYWFIYGYMIYDFSHFLHHYWGHRIRLFWCLHATHHVPSHMNLTVSWSHFYIENLYADIIRLGICSLMGLELGVMIMVYIVDSLWGHFIHTSEELLPDGRLGFLSKFLLTPSHHRVHHSCNPEYIDKNYCNLIPIYDRLFGTYQAELENVPPKYGITRDVNTQSLFDVYFGEFVCLFHDIKNAPSIGNKIAYLFKPPGWHPKAVLTSKNELEDKT
ncbi:MAG: sterol desaturase family protein [Kordiimonadaceae bacterium]|jgi:sterol desaturase/sphingolipid hydroxylase (fatty acid hydroxylase superfamily)|nr:sterol desaturase family protein [Kordiimonadaceae bacterium]MBT6033156.1 sterol desaturase family protein [Kordiimonadaceae bacterium]